jgi:hypothetical protein
LCAIVAFALTQILSALQMVLMVLSGWLDRREREGSRT